MGKSKTIPLARGLVGGEVNPIYGQLEVFLTNYKNVKITIRRKPYSGHSDIQFAIPWSDFQDIIEVLLEAKEKLDLQWLSRVAVRQSKAQ